MHVLRQNKPPEVLLENGLCLVENELLVHYPVNLCLGLLFKDVGAKVGLLIVERNYIHDVLRDRQGFAPLIAEHF